MNWHGRWPGNLLSALLDIELTRHRLALCLILEDTTALFMTLVLDVWMMFPGEECRSLSSA